MFNVRLCFAVVCLCSMGSLALGQDAWWAGFGKVDITPTEPVRLSGYSTRDKPHTDVADRLFARAMVLTSTEGNASALDARQTGKRSLVLVSIDSIAIVGKMTRQVEEELSSRYGITRSEFVICSTHSHAAPHAASGLTNIYRTPLSSDEQAAIDRHADRVAKEFSKPSIWPCHRESELVWKSPRPKQTLLSTGAC